MQAEAISEYQDLGKGPAVMLLHDFLLSPNCWKQQINPLLQAGFRVILPDLAACPRNGQLREFSHQIIGLLNRLGLGRAVVLGMGMGGMILFDLLERFPERIAGAGFIGTRPVADDIQEKAKRGELIADLLQGDSQGVRRELLKTLLGGRENHFSAFDNQMIRKMVNRCTEKELINAQKAIAGRKDYSQLLKSLTLPTLVIGSEQNHLCHPTHTRIMAGQLPNCFRSINLDAGPLVQLEQANTFNQHLLAFLQAIAPCRFSLPKQSPRQAA